MKTQTGALPRLSKHNAHYLRWILSRIDRTRERSMETPIAKDDSGQQYAVTWCDGNHMRVTPLDGDPTRSDTVKVGSLTIVSGQEELDRMVGIFGRA